MADVLRTQYIGSDQKCSLCKADCVSYHGGTPNACSTCGKLYCSSCYGLRMKLDVTPRDDVACASCEELTVMLSGSFPTDNDVTKPNDFNPKSRDLNPASRDERQQPISNMRGLTPEPIESNEIEDWSKTYPSYERTTHTQTGSLNRSFNTSTYPHVYRKSVRTSEMNGQHQYTNPSMPGYPATSNTLTAFAQMLANGVADSDDDIPCYHDIPHALILAGVYSDSQLKRSMLKQALKDEGLASEVTPAAKSKEKPRPKKVNKNKNIMGPKIPVSSLRSHGHNEISSASSNNQSTTKKLRNESGPDGMSELSKSKSAITSPKKVQSKAGSRIEYNRVKRPAPNPFIDGHGGQKHDVNTNHREQGKLTDLPTAYQTDRASPVLSDAPGEGDRDSKTAISISIKLTKQDLSQSNDAKPDSSPSAVGCDLELNAAVNNEYTKPAIETSKMLRGDDKNKCRKCQFSNVTEKTEEIERPEKPARVVYGPKIPPIPTNDKSKDAKATEMNSTERAAKLDTAKQSFAKLHRKSSATNNEDAFNDVDDIDDEDLPYAMSLLRPSKMNLLLVLSDPVDEGETGTSMSSNDMGRKPPTLLITFNKDKMSSSSALQKILETGTGRFSDATGRKSTFSSSLQKGLQIPSGRPSAPDSKYEHKQSNINLEASKDDIDTILKSFTAQISEQRHLAFTQINTSVETTHTTCSACRRPECQGEQFVKMKTLINVARREGFDIYDVIPDGNCMFAAVVDQLQQYGIEGYDHVTLRQAAVCWLADNPCSADGTPFAQFMEESWDTYLHNMGNDGQWGDHVVLRAMSELLNRTIRVLNPINGDLWTVITPQNNRTDGDRMPLHLGHVGEFHYTSLRYTDHHDELAPGLTPSPVVMETDPMKSLDLTSLTEHETRLVRIFEENYVDEESKTPTTHLSFLMKTLCDDHSTDLLLSSLKVACSMLTDSWYFLFQLDLHDLLKSTSRGGNSYMAPFPVLEGHRAVSGNDPNLKPGDYVLVDHGVHPGFTMLKDGHCNFSGQEEKFVSHSVCKTITLEQQDFAESLMNIEVIQCPNWPDSASEWSTRPRREGWPEPSVIRDVINEGCHLIAKGHRLSSQPEIEWRFSFALAETTLFREAVTPAQKSCFILFTALCMDAVLYPPLGLTESLRSVFLLACERVPTEMWTSHTGSCLMYMVKELLYFLDVRFLPNYFVPANNMLDCLEEVGLNNFESHIRELNLRPSSMLPFISKYSMIGVQDKIVARVSDDFSLFEIDRDIRRSTLDVFVPLLTESAKEKLTLGYYEMGFRFLTEAFEERLSVSTCDDTLPFQFFLTDAMNSLDRLTVTWFCAYVSKQLGPQLSSSMVRESRGYADLRRLDSVLPEDLTNGYGAVEIPASWCEDRLKVCAGFGLFLARIKSNTPALGVFIHCHMLYQERIANGGFCDMESVANDETETYAMIEVYVGLFKIYQIQNNLEQFDDNFPCLQQICERLNTYGSINLLAIIAVALKKTELVKKLSEKKSPKMTYKCDILHHMFFKWPYYINV